jgi:16S rRNA C967 or C1407 C5-methylase (RsmB/RsmF family)
MVVETFLKLDPRFGLVKVDPDIGEHGMRGLTQSRRLYPHLDESNGYFIAVMNREVD